MLTYITAAEISRQPWGISVTLGRLNEPTKSLIILVNLLAR